MTKDNIIQFSAGKQAYEQTQLNISDSKLATRALLSFAQNANPLVQSILDENEDLIETYSKPEYVNQPASGKLPLYYCFGQTMAGHLDKRHFYRLLDKTTSLNTPDSDGNTLMHLITNYFTHVYQRVKKNATDTRSSEQQAVLSAYVEELITHGADMHAKNKDGKTPIKTAIESDCAPLISLFHKRGAFEKTVWDEKTGILTLVSKKETFKLVLTAQNERS